MAVNNKSKSAPDAEANPASAKSAAAHNARRRALEEDDAYNGTPLSMTGIRGHLMASWWWKGMLGLMIFIFALGFYFTGSAPRSDGPGAPRSGGPSIVATNGNQSVTRDEYLNTLTRQMQFMQQYQPTTPQTYLSEAARTLENLADQAGVYDEAVNKGFTPTGAEIEAEIKRLMDEEIKNNEGDNPTRFRRQIEAQYGSMDKFRETMSNNLNSNRDAVAKQLTIDKLKKSIEEKNSTTEADYKKSVTKLNLYQIVVNVKPVDFKAADRAADEKKKADEAKAKAEKLAAQLKSATTAQFMEEAKKSSDDVTTKTKGGLVGWKKPAEASVPAEGQMVLQNATGSLAGPVQDYSKNWVIFHIAGRKEDLPKDYAKEKAKLLKDYETGQDTQAWTKFQEDLKKQKIAKIEDPAIAAWKIQSDEIGKAKPEAQAGLRQAALAKYSEAVAYATSDEAAAIHYQMSELYKADNKSKEALESLQKAVKEAPRDPNLHIQLANQYQTAKQNKEALEQLKLVSKQLDESPSRPSMFGGSPDTSYRMQIASTFEALGEKKLAEAERKKIPPPQPGGMPGMGGLGAPGGLQISPSR